jgi:hypothetical protein
MDQKMCSPQFLKRQIYSIIQGDQSLFSHGLQEFSLVGSRDANGSRVLRGPRVNGRAEDVT